MAATPSSEPTATFAANAGPWSRAMKKVTGPEVKGRAISQPPMKAPHRRPATLAAPMRTGVSTSLSRTSPTRAA